MLQRDEPGRPKWLLLLPAMLLAGCATTSPTSSVDCPAPPSMPAAQQPQPPVNYSLSVEQLLQTWRAKLMGTPPTP